MNAKICQGKKNNKFGWTENISREGLTWWLNICKKVFSSCWSKRVTQRPSIIGRDWLNKNIIKISFHWHQYLQDVGQLHNWDQTWWHHRPSSSYFCRKSIMMTLLFLIIMIISTSKIIVIMPSKMEVASQHWTDWTVDSWDNWDQ